MLSDQRQLLQLIRAALSPSLVTQAEEAPFNSAVALRGLNTLLGTRVVLWDVNTPFPDIWEDAVFLADDPHAGLLLPCATGRNNFSGKAVLGRDFRPVLPHGTKLHTKTAQLRFPDIFAYFLRTYLKTALQRRVERLSQGSVVELCQLLMALGSQELLPVIQNKLHAWMVSQPSLPATDRHNRTQQLTSLLCCCRKSATLTPPTTNSSSTGFLTGQRMRSHGSRSASSRASG